MTRYWQHRDVEDVCGRDHDHSAAEAWTEVQVVPLDAIVIERSELPEVTPGDGANAPVGALRTTHGYHNRLSAAWHRDLARHHLALAQYVETHPPVDEAQVQALAVLISDAIVPDEDDSLTPEREMARRLLATGRVQVKP